MTEVIKVILVDDHRMVREGLAAMLVEEGGDIQVVGQASNGLEALELVGRIPCDVLVCDVSMPGMGGIELIETLKAQNRLPNTLMLSMHDSSHIVERAFRAGAMGYVEKTAEYRYLVLAIQSVARGMQVSSIKARGDFEKPEVELSPREQEIVNLLVSCLSNADIAKKLRISAKTVSTHKTNVLVKLGLRNEVDLVKWALRREGSEFSDSR